MAFTALTFTTLEVLSSTKMTQLYGNTYYFYAEAAAPSAAWTPTGNWAPTGAWTFTPGSAIVPLTLTQGYAADAMNINNNSTQLGLNIVQTGVLAAYKYGLSVYSNTAQTTCGLVNFELDHASSSQQVVNIKNDGTGWALYATGNYVGAANAVAHFAHDGNSVNAHGVYVTAGTDDSSGTSVLMNFADGDGTGVGNITHSGGSVSYNCLMGHPSFVKNDKKYPFGTIMINIEASKENWYFKKYGLQPHEPNTVVESSKKANDSRVFGVSGGESFGNRTRIKKDKLEGKIHIENIEDRERFQIYTIGRCFILVCNENGNIENGDYICSSNMEGHGMKQNDDLLHNYTVAKALEGVDWKKEKSDVKLISCTLHAA